MSDRELVLQALQKMPESLTLAEIIDELRLLDTVQQGLRDIDTGTTRGVPHADVEKLVKKWVTESSGRNAA